MLRHYDTIGLVQPTGRTGSGYREYSAADIRRIFHVESLRSLGLSLREVGRALDDPGFDPAGLVDDLITRTRERIADETRLLTRLQRISGSGAGGWEDVLQIVSLLQGLGSEDAGRRQRAAMSAADEVPVEVLVEAVLSESDTNVAGALRWALVRSGADALDLLAAGLRTGTAEVRGRAVRAIAALPGEAATALLREVAADADAGVRRTAVLALGSRGAAEAVPALVDMIVDNVSDADAADALSALAGEPVPADRIAAVLTGRIAEVEDGAARQRLTQALADIPGEVATRSLTELSGDADRAVALTATYVLTLRGSTTVEPPAG